MIDYENGDNEVKEQVVQRNNSLAILVSALRWRRGNWQQIAFIIHFFDAAVYHGTIRTTESRAILPCTYLALAVTLKAADSHA